MAEGDPGVPGVVLGLMAVNVGVFALWHTWGLDHPGAMLDHFVVSLDAVRAGRVWTLLTSEVSHVDATHLLVNLIALWAFGTPVARVMGPHRFMALYAAGGFCASLGHVLWNLGSGDGAGALGASGAVGAVAIVFALWFPRATILLGFLIPMPAWVAAVAFVLLDLFGVFGAPVDLLADGQSTRVAHAAHLGGAAVGLVAGLAPWFRGRVARRRAEQGGRTPSP